MNRASETCVFIYKMKCTSISIMEVIEREEKGKKVCVSGGMHEFEERMTENLPNLMKDVNLHTQEAQQILTGVNSEFHT